MYFIYAELLFLCLVYFAILS